MLDVLKARWQTHGWHVMAKEDSEPMALEFIKVLDTHEIPYRHYRELYTRSVDLRARRMSQGLNCDDFSVDMMIACWPSLRTDLRDREIGAGRTLTGQAQTHCTRCLGTGRIITEQGVGPICTHEFDESIDTDEIGWSPAVDIARETAHIYVDETDEQILRRLAVQLTYNWTQAEPGSFDANQLWQAVGCLKHAERYCRDHREDIAA